MHYPIVWCVRTSIVLFALFSITHQLSAQPISYIMVERVGSGVGALTSGSTAVFMETYLPTTGGQSSYVNQVIMPTTSSPAQKALTESGTATSAGLFTRFANRQGYAISGYDTAPGLAGVATSSPATVNRIVGTIDSSLNLTTLTGFNNGTSVGFRSAATVDGSSFYGTVAAASDGLVYLSSPNTIQTYTQIVSANPRQVHIFNNSLFYSTSSGTASANGIFLAGTAGTLPTSSVTPTQLPGLGTSGTGTPNANGFYLLNNPLNANNWNGTGLNTLYVADDRGVGTGGGIQRWIFNGTVWSLNGTFGVPARGLAASVDVDGLVSIWYTTSVAASNNSLVFLPDTLTATGGTFGSATTLINSGVNSVFRGVDLDLVVSVPEPGTYALIGVAGFFGLQWYLRRKAVQKVPAGASEGSDQ